MLSWLHLIHPLLALFLLLISASCITNLPVISDHVHIHTPQQTVTPLPDSLCCLCFRAVSLFACLPVWHHPFIWRLIAFIILLLRMSGCFSDNVCVFQDRPSKDCCCSSTSVSSSAESLFMCQLPGLSQAKCTMWSFFHALEHFVMIIWCTRLVLNVTWI